jgi:hypothetical protein
MGQGQLIVPRIRKRGRGGAAYCGLLFAMRRRSEWLMMIQYVSNLEWAGTVGLVVHSIQNV